MISIKRFNGTQIYLNPELIQMVEGTPDTVITLTNGTKIIVKDLPETVVKKFIAYQQLVHNPLLDLDLGD